MRLLLPTASERKMRPYASALDVLWSGVIGFQDNIAVVQISHLHLNSHCPLPVSASSLERSDGRLCRGGM